MGFSSESERNSRQDFVPLVVAGKVPGYSFLFKFGNNPDIDTGTVPVDIWEGSGLYTGQPVGAAEKIHCFSSSALDTSNGTGARTILIIGLNELWDEVMEVVVLNGATPVLTTNFYNRMYRAIVLSAGATGSNQGIITARHQSTIANVFMRMQPNTNQTQIACYTVPRGKTGFLGKWNAFLVDAQATYGRMAGYIRNYGEVWRHISPISLHREQNLVVDFGYSVAISEKSDLRVSCLEVSSNDTGISSNFTMLLIDNNKLT